MDSKSYKAWALTKDRKYENKGERLIHGALGSAGEVGELVDAIKKHVMYGKDLDKEHLKEELGDCLWYFSILLDEIGSSFEEVMQMNHDKLEKRYPSGYTNEAAIVRADKKSYDDIVGALNDEYTARCLYNSSDEAD